MNDETNNHNKQNYHILDTQDIILDDFPVSGLILDIGGGCEGIIGQLKGKQVIAIDPNRRELEEAADGPLKIIMNAKDLQFLDESFDVATAFFTFMYIKTSDHEQVFEEVYRVLEPGGRFLFWDLSIPQRSDQEEDIAVLILKIILPDQEIETGYGTKWPSKTIDIDHYKGIAEDLGFTLFDHYEKGNVFFLELLKPEK